ncbi:MAG: hypothetical protein N3I35_07190 [Clostridia bacterium]|nr:hypothetical protein [Clostridia bacterium]
MTDETLLEIQKKINRAQAIKRQVSELKKLRGKTTQIKLWGICLYYDEECKEGLYTDLPLEDVSWFINEYIMKKVEGLEQEFAAL